MRKIGLIILSLVLGVAIAAAQNNGFGGDAATTSTTTAKAVEIRIHDEPSGLNGWGGPYSDRSLAALLAEMASSNSVILASSTREILDEARDRDQLSGNRWVDQTSSRLQPGTIIPALISWEVVAGGDMGTSRSTTIRIGNYSISTESGRATMWIAVSLKDLVTGQTLATVVAKGVDGSTNITGFDRQDNWFSRNRLPIDFSRWDNGDPSYRRALIASQRAIEDLRKKIMQLYTTRDSRH